jgi:D-alanyl-D-alanine carboxypeptidase (penicillin-binding protein 5/6)
MRKGRFQATHLISLCLVVILTSTLKLSWAQEMPQPFALAAQSAVLIDANSGEFLYGQNPDERISPASFVKLMTLLLIFDAVDQGQVLIEDKVWISEKAWRTGGSKMFVRQGNRVPLEELIKGIAVVSGNDACIAVAEFLQGNEQAFVVKMNERVQKLHLENTQFQTVNGWPAPDQYTSARDMALIARVYVQEHPQAIKYHQLKDFTHENIRQKNRNGLLRRDPTVDGLKTGHTENAGYHLLATAKRGDQRFIAVVMGAKSEAIREREALRLLNYGFRNFASVSLFKQGDVLLRLPVWKGTVGEIELAASEPGIVTLPIDLQADISWQARTPERLFAPIESSQSIGEAVIATKEKVFKTVPLVAVQDVPLAGFFRQVFHSAALITKDHGLSIIFVILMFAAVVFGVIYLKRSRPKRKRSTRH